MAKRHNKRKVNIALWVVLVVIAVVLIFAGVVVYNNRHNIKAIYSAGKLSKDEITVKQEENRQKTQDILDSITSYEIKELPEEVRRKMQTGEITPEQSLSIIMGEATVEEVVNPNNETTSSEEQKEVPDNSASSEKVEEPVAEAPKPQETQKPANDYGKKDEIIGRIYLLRAEFLNKIDACVASGKEELAKIPYSEWTASRKMAFINKYANQGNALETSCDARMEQLLSELEAELSKTGESTSVIGEIRNAYNEQKQIKKEELFSLYYE